MKRFLSDTIGWMTDYTLKENKDGGPLTIEGVFGAADRVNGNKRLYPKAVLEAALGSKREVIEGRGMYGELDHPSDGSSEIRLDKASHIITSLTISEDGSMPGRLQVLDGPHGRQLEAIARAQGRIGLSTRGLGSVKRRKADGVDVVGEDFELITVDVVANPSAPGAFGSIAESQAQDEEQEPPMTKKSFNELRDLARRIIGSNIKNMSESERERSIDEATDLIVELEIGYLSEVGHASVTAHLIAQLQEKSEEISADTTPPPSKMLEAAVKVIDKMGASIVEREAKIVILIGENENLAEKIELAETLGQEVMDQLQESRRELQLSSAVGQKLLEKAKSSRRSRKNKAITNAVSEVLDDKNHLEPMRDQLEECATLADLDRMVEDLDKFYTTSQHPMLESITSSKKDGGKVRRKPKSSTRLSESQRLDVRLLDKMEQFSGTAL